MTLPQWSNSEDRRRIQTAAAQAARSLTFKPNDFGDIDVATISTLNQAFPEYPWPTSVDDLELAPTPGIPQVLQPKWVNAGGTVTQILKQTWDDTYRYIARAYSPRTPR